MLQWPICDKEYPAQILLPAADSDLTNLLNKEFSIIEMNITENEPDVDTSATDSDMESLNFLDTQGRTLWVRLMILMMHTTTRRSLWDIAKVPKEQIHKYCKDLGPEGSNIKSAYWLLDAVDELESGMGMKSWKAKFVSFTKAEIPDGEEQDEPSLTQKFFFHNPLDCTKYLLGQRCFAQDLVHTPAKE
ncbi:hypothetical protein L873DRAFT_1789634 [Choiromyces venosus 120613-1]|uniref:Uncharacterized protein n=1 Tax=Choiromyces venosus 120613-1 TaxID=1336337 RepID=A0A3N4K0Q3_9PEZI|nr:hypothetical protein L873DRAFT_1789634 [Choiromyces venosus 120613-1]